MAHDRMLTFFMDLLQSYLTEPAYAKVTRCTTPGRKVVLDVIVRKDMPLAENQMLVDLPRDGGGGQFRITVEKL